MARSFQNPLVLQPRVLLPLIQQIKVTTKVGEETEWSYPVLPELAAGLLKVDEVLRCQTGVEIPQPLPNIAQFGSLDPYAVITPVNLEVMGKDATSVDQEG